MTNPSKYNSNFHHRRSIRLKGYDYSQAGLYFITICCQDRICRFGHVENGKMKLNPLGQIAYDEWANTENIRNNVILHEFIIMPNHIHGIIEIIKNSIESDKDKLKSSTGESQFAPIEESQFTPINKLFAPTELKFASTFKSPSQTIGSIIRGYKIATIKKIKDFINDTGKFNNSTGESQFAPTNKKNASTESQSINDASESQFAPTDFKLWQRNYYEHIIKDERAYENISNYIINNPIKWAEDKFHLK